MYTLIAKHNYPHFKNISHIFPDFKGDEHLLLQLSFFIFFYIEVGCKVQNEDASVTGDAPIIIKWSTILLLTNVPPIS